MLASLRQKGTNRRGIIIVIILSILLVALVLNGFVRETIAPALLSWLWHVYLMSSGFPQVMTWAFFVAAIPVIAIFSLVRGRPSIDEDVNTEQEQHLGPVQTYAQLLRQAPEGDYFRMRLIRHLSKLALETLEYRQRLAYDDIKKALESGQIQAEPEVRHYLQTGWRKRAYEARPNGSGKNRPSTAAGKASRSEHHPWLDPDTDKVIRFLESEMEVERES